MPNQDVRSLPWLTRVVKISRIPFAGLAASAFFTGYWLTGNVRPWLMVLGLLTYFLDQAAGAMFNAYSDRQEDSVNMPEFVAVCDSVGYPTIKRIAYGIKAITFFGPMAIIYWYPTAVIIGCLASLFPPLYSLGPRFKRSAALSFISHGVYAGIPFLTGWALGRGAAIPLSVWAVSFLLLWSFAINRTIRSFPDMEGDKQSGDANFWTYLAENGRLRTWQMILITPYLFIALFVATRILPVRMLWVLPLGCGAFALGYLLTAARQPMHRAAAWYWGVLYSMIVHAAILMALMPTLAVWAAAIGMLLIRLAFGELNLDYRPSINMRRLFKLTAETLAGRVAHAKSV